jgi:hypothetical protein
MRSAIHKPGTIIPKVYDEKANLQARCNNIKSIMRKPTHKPVKIKP